MGNISPLEVSAGERRVNNKYNVFRRQYYSGSDVSVYFNNQPVEEIVSIFYEMKQNVQGLFGYASFTWDTVTYGNRFVEGKFRINFKESFYIRSILEKLKQDAAPYNVSIKDTYKKLLQESAWEGHTLNELMQQLNNLTNPADIQELADAYEKKLWGQNTYIDKSKETHWANVYGGYDYKDNDGEWNSVYNDLLRHGFDIIIAFGDKITEMDQDAASRSGTTAVVLNDVHLTGYGTVYEPNGEPIYEEYSFMARDTNDSLTLSGELAKNTVVPVKGGGPSHGELV